MPIVSNTASKPSLWTAMMRGLKRQCPHCGEGAAFSSYVKVVAKCDHCGAELGRMRADDAPPYFTIVIVGHLILPLVMLAEDLWAPSTWLHLVMWLPLTTFMTLAMLPFVKGATLGIMAGVGIRGDESSDNPVA